MDALLLINSNDGLLKRVFRTELSISFQVIDLPLLPSPTIRMTIKHVRRAVRRRNLTINVGRVLTFCARDQRVSIDLQIDLTNDHVPRRYGRHGDRKCRGVHSIRIVLFLSFVAFPGYRLVVGPRGRSRLPLGEVTHVPARRS